MKKFNALLFAMALVAVVAFASVAFAATTQFLGLDTNGKVVVINVDPSKTTNKVTYEGYTITGAPSIIDPNSFVKLFAYDDGFIALSADKAGDGSSQHQPMQAHTFTMSDGVISYGKKYTAASSGDIRGVITFDNHPVILGTKGIWVISNDALTGYHCSVDVAFQYNSKLYVINSDDNQKGQNAIFEFSKISDVAYAYDAANKSKLKYSPMNGPNNAGSNGMNLGNFSSVLLGNTLYIANGASFDKFVIAESVVTQPTLKEVPTLGNDKYWGMFEKDGKIYAVEQKSDADLYLVSLTIGDNVITKNTVLSKLSADLVGANNGLGSFDIYYDSNNDVFGVVNHGHALAIFTPNSDGGWSFVESRDFLSAAMVTTASTTPDTPVTPTTTVVDASTLATASQDNLVAATPASAISDFVTAEEASTTTVPTGAQAKIEALLKTDDKTTVTLAAKTNYTLAKDGYLLVKKAVDVSKVRVYFVEAATTTAATGDLTAATFLDADCKEMGSTGTSVYAASDKLESGKTYTLVEATVSTSSSGDDGDSSGSTTSSSSGGCDAGFGLWAAAALMAVSTISKRR